MFGPLLEVKSTSLRYEEHFQVKIHKTHNARITFGTWNIEKIHIVVIWKNFEIKINKLCHFQTTFGNYDVEKVRTIMAAKYI